MGSMGLWKGHVCNIKTLELKQILFVLYRIFLIINTFIGMTMSRHSWERPGCHKVGYQRTVEIDGCIAFNITTNACRGFCTSYAYPSPVQTLAADPKHKFTSRAECCGIDETHDRIAFVSCLKKVDQRTSGSLYELQKKIFKSAKSCACSICRGN